MLKPPILRLVLGQIYACGVIIVGVQEYDAVFWGGGNGWVHFISRKGWIVLKMGGPRWRAPVLEVLVVLQ